MLYQGIKGAVRVERRALAPDGKVGTPGNSLLERVNQPRLADPGFARDKHDLSFAALGALPSPQQDLELLIAADHFRHGRRTESVEAAFDAPRPFDRPDPHRSFEALQLPGAEIGAVEQRAGQPEGGFIDYHGAGLGELLQPRRKIGRVARDGTDFRDALADQIARDHKPGRDPDPRAQRDVLVRRQLSDALRDIESRADGALSVVLMGDGIAEIGQNAVSEKFGDKPVIPLDNRRCRLLICTHHAPQVLGIEPGGKRSGADEITEHDCELAAFGLARGCGRGWGFRRCLYAGCRTV